MRSSGVQPPLQKVAIVVGYFEVARQLPFHSDCGRATDDAIVFCEPVVDLRLRVTDQVGGDRIPAYLRATTINHWGSQSFQYIGQGYPYLMRIVSDGQSFVVEPYQFAALAVLDDHELAIPVDGPEDMIDWLPCEASDQHERLKFVMPAKAFRRTIDASDPEAPRPNEFVSISGNRLKVVRGIKVESIRDVLKQTVEQEAGCDR